MGSHVAVWGVVGGTSDAAEGDVDAVLPWASVTKLATSLAVVVACEEGTLSFDQACGPPGSTVRHLLAHASGLHFTSDAVLAAPGTRRIYSNTGYEVLGRAVAESSGMPFEQYLGEAVLSPLGMTSTALRGTPAAGLVGPLRDLLLLAGELRRPTLVTTPMRDVAFPGLPGVLPGFGQQRSNDWGLGPEVRGWKSPHWTSTRNSPRTFGHFGASGSFLWVDPEADLAACYLGDRPFGDWAVREWPRLSDRILES
ncbi:MAG TPA: serine hydrolase domain-containing protein [Acidimicrobiales bacterium]|nr:serine hydrolase domain-containing protein [Acidimicrobiales bacterium]